MMVHTQLIVPIHTIYSPDETLHDKEATKEMNLSQKPSAPSTISRKL